MGLSWEIPLSTFAHMVGFGLVAVVGQCTSAPAPLFKPEDVMIVEMSGAALLNSRMPQRAERTPDSAAGEVAPSEAPPPNPDQMKFQTPDAPPAKGDPKADAEREKLINEMRKQAALKDLSAPLGTTDRAASSPEGSANPDGATSSGVHDPELARWVAKARQAVADHWHPLRATCLANPSLTTVIRAPVEADGRLSESPTIAQSSGNTSIDEAGRRAVESTGRLPPLPARFPDGLVGTIKFVCKESL